MSAFQVTHGQQEIVEDARNRTIRRFWAKVSRGPGCWEWTGSRNPVNGYGQFHPTKHTNYRAHRFAYEVSVGPIPPGMLVMHACDNRRCVNPAHLSLGTQLDNMRDAVAKGRTVGQRSRWTHCLRGHEFTVENTGYRKGHKPDKRERFCRICTLEQRRQANRRWYDRHRRRA